MLTLKPNHYVKVTQSLSNIFHKGFICSYRDPYGGYGEGREPRPRSRSPMHGRDSRAHRGSREHSREPGREPRHPRDHHEPRDPNFDRYRTPEGRDKDLRGEPRGEPRGDPRDPTFR